MRNRILTALTAIAVVGCGAAADKPAGGFGTGGGDTASGGAAGSAAAGSTAASPTGGKPGNPSSGGVGGSPQQPTGGASADTGGTGNTTGSTCARGIRTGAACDPSIDTEPCVLTNRTCQCGADSTWSCAQGGGPTSTGGAGTGGRGDLGTGGVSSPDTGGTSNTGTGGRSNTGTGGRSNTGTGGTRAGGGATTGGAAAGGSGPPPLDKKFVGNIDTRGSIKSDFSQYWDQFSPENAGKWGSTQPSSQSQFSWNSLDAMHDYCKANNIIFKEHCFIWGSQQPNWVNDSNGEAAVKNWMKTFCDRYPDVALIDVVNEPPPHTTPRYKNGIGGDGSSGWDWIVNAFKWAREACPNAVLILNDYNNIEWPNDVSHFLDIVNKIKAAGAPIDAIGCQSHDAYRMDNATLKGNMDKLAGTGLPLYITEFDIPDSNDSSQKSTMEREFTLFYENPDVLGITYWGYVVGATWKNGTGLLNGSTPRPALTWLMDYLGR